MKINNLIQVVLFGLMLQLGGCSGGDDAPDLGSVSSNYPRLISTPQVSFVRNSFSPSEYDVTVTLNADGPAGVFSVSLWLHSSSNDFVFDFLELRHTAGTSWSVTTMSLLSLPAGTYYIDSIKVEDGDPFLNGIVKSSWYVIGFSGTHYTVDQRQTQIDWDDLSNQAILNYNIALAGMPIVRFTLP